MKKLLFAAIIVTVAFAACKKKDTSTPTPTPTPTPVDTNKASSRYEALTTDKWKISELYFINKDGIMVVDYYNGTMPECEKDNFIYFNKDGSIKSNEGASKCDTAVAQETTDGNWSLNADTTQFVINDSKILHLDGKVSAKVILIDNNNFKISKDTTVLTIPGTLYASFKKVK